MTMREFIRENREALDEYIDAPRGLRNDVERELWVMNDEGLYKWARAEGVRA